MADIKFSKNFNKFLHEEMKKQAKKASKEALKKTADDIEKLIRDFIQNEFYREFTPRIYERTGRFLRSVTQTDIYKEGNKYKIAIWLDPTKEGDYDNGGRRRFYIDRKNRVVYPKTSQFFDANQVFIYASHGIHGLPVKGKSGWTNYSYYQSDKSLVNEINKQIQKGQILRKFSDYIQSQGFKVFDVRI